MTLIWTNHGEDLREVLLQAIIENENVNTSWESLSRNIPNEALSMILKKQFMLKWIQGSLVCEKLCTNFEKGVCKI